MMPSGIRIALPKLFLWSETSRIQEYAAALARAVPGRIYSRLEVERELFDIVPTLEFKGGAPRGRRTDGIVNSYGLERSGNRFKINGIGLLKRQADGLTATESGLHLGELFRGNPAGRDWVIVLARQILMREPRTRLLIRLLLSGYSLEVSVVGTSPTGNLGLIDTHSVVIPIPSRDCIAFNDLLAANAEVALGPLWRNEIASTGEFGPIHWEGVQGGTPSLNDLPAALKKSLAVFFHIGLLTGHGQEWRLDAEDVQATLGDEVLDGFGVTRPPVQVALSPEQAFAHALTEVQDCDGFVIVSRVADSFGRRLGIPSGERPLALDQFVRAAMYDDRLRVMARHAGQPRMGRGLFGENDSRRVRIDFHVATVGEITEPAPQTVKPGGNSNSGEKR
jgi:hypothetical protein